MLEKIIANDEATTSYDLKPATNTSSWVFVAQCLLCDEEKHWVNEYPPNYVSNHGYAYICDNCKKIWKKLKEQLKEIEQTEK